MTDILPDFEQYLQESISNGIPGQVREAMTYSLMAGGKRVRPALLFAALKGYGLDPKAGFPAASAIEMIHTYSLIHDDLPAMDNDDYRRGRPSCHKAFGEANAILAGDALLTQAFDQIASCDNPDINPEQKVKLIHYLSDYSGAQGMVYGQELDIAADETDRDLEDLWQIQRYKTGKLLTLPFIMAAVMAGREEDIPLWMQAGEALGLEFQVQDDILDVEKSAAELGKSNSDAENEKCTAVTILGLDGAKAKVNELNDILMDTLDKLEEDHHFQTGPVREICEGLLTRQK